MYEPGAVVVIDVGASDEVIGCVVRRTGDVKVRVMQWQPKTGRWLRPQDVLITSLGVAPTDSLHKLHGPAATARANIERHRGVLPCGGTAITWVRVWSS